MKQIEKYIQFAIDNKYDWLDKYKDLTREVYEYEWEYTIIIDSDFICEENINLLQIITSRSFIEAVARGVVNKSSYEIHNEQWRNTKFYIILNRLIREDKVVDFLRNEISKAIFNKELREFIEKIIDNE